MSLLFKIGFLEIKWVDLLDIALVSLLLFSLYRLVRGTVALKILTGFLILYIIFLIVQATRMELLTLILDKFMSVSIIAAIILFQQEIRKFLLIIGRTTDLNGFNPFQFLRKSKAQLASDMHLHAIIEALKVLSNTYTGALIVLEKNNALDSYIDTGERIDATISRQLLITIFNKNSPLHDGAVIVSKGRLRAARCILPVSDNRQIPANMGLRHRAAIGLSELTDCLVLVVSEETGAVSIVRGGAIEHALTLADIRDKVNQHFLSPA